MKLRETMKTFIRILASFEREREREIDRESKVIWCEICREVREDNKELSDPSLAHLHLIVSCIYWHAIIRQGENKRKRRYFPRPRWRRQAARRITSLTAWLTLHCIARRKCFPFPFLPSSFSSFSLSSISRCTVDFPSPQSISQLITFRTSSHCRIGVEFIEVDDEGQFFFLFLFLFLNFTLSPLNLSNFIISSFHSFSN